jgi:DNA-binding MarR family transcriptional regulator
MEVYFKLSRLMMEASYIAKCMSAYLMGAYALEGLHATRCPDGSFMMNGPWWDADVRRWILNDSNDYWLYIEGDECTLSCRHRGQYDVLLAMRRLFLLRVRTPCGDSTVADRARDLAERGLVLNWGRSTGAAFALKRGGSTLSQGDDSAELIDEMWRAPVADTSAHLNARERTCLEELVAYYNAEGNCLYMGHIASTTGLTLSQVRRSVRSLARKGLVELVRGLTDDEGLLRGSGYCATRTGRDLVATPLTREAS